MYYKTGALVEDTARMNTLRCGEHLRARLNNMYPLINQNTVARSQFEQKLTGLFIMSGFRSSKLSPLSLYSICWIQIATQLRLSYNPYNP